MTSKKNRTRIAKKLRRAGVSWGLSHKVAKHVDNLVYIDAIDLLREAGHDVTVERYHCQCGSCDPSVDAIIIDGNRLDV